jgi:hypothetical protein
MFSIDCILIALKHWYTLIHSWLFGGTLGETLTCLFLVFALDFLWIYSKVCLVFGLSLMTHMTSKTHTYASQAIATLPSTHALKSQWFPPICDDPLWLMWAIDFIQVVDFLLHSNASKPRDLSLSPMQPSIPCPVLFDILYSYPRLLFEIISFPLPCSLPFHCKV